jgi:CheY-like chemotaxis protein
MKWKNAGSDHLPRISGKFLISYKGVYHLAYFHKALEKFEIVEEPGRIILQAPYHQLYWTEVDAEIKTPRSEAFRILIADDETDDQMLMKAGLAKATIKVEVDAVSDGAEVLDYLLRRGEFKHLGHTPDLLLLDLNMPKVDGFQVLTEIRKHKHLNDLPVYVITTSRHIDDWDRALELGANGFYSKGSKEDDLRHIMQEVCRQCFGEIFVR